MTSPTPGELITGDAVAKWLGMDSPDEHIATVVPAVAAYVREVHGDGPDYAETVKLGALMLAALIVRRRNSPGGIDEFGSLEPSYVARYDPTISQLLQLGNFRRLVVG